jgi:DNA invertase Pin-like site-specific DNA recombinase
MVGDSILSPLGRESGSRRCARGSKVWVGRSRLRARPAGARRLRSGFPWGAVLKLLDVYDAFPHSSSREAERDKLREAFDYCREGDVLVVARLDRLGRSLRELIDLVGELEGKGVGFRSLKESLDTTTAGGRLIFHVFGALAEFEREIIRERTMAGLESARARGRRGGRPRALDENRAKLARRLKGEGEHSVEEICSMLGVGRSTLYRYLGKDGHERGGKD